MGEIMKVETKSNRPDSTEISIKEFLDYLKSAYQLQVQEDVEKILLADGMTEAVDWLKLKQSALIASKSEEENGEKIDENESLKSKLSEVLSEGLLDSVLPYIVSGSSRKSTSSSNPSSNQSLSKKSAVGVAIEAIINVKQPDPETKIIPTKSAPPIKTESEIEIHVCDESKNIRTSFICKQTLLVEKMRYFGEVTNGQNLQDMEISVHCDVAVFDWLMRWMHVDALPIGDQPQLDAQSVVPILVSAAFLQMEPLKNECLLYCHQNMNEILRTTANLSCINDSILTQLASMYTNAEVDAIRDRKDRIQSKLYTKLIQSLAEIEPECVRGHWRSLATIYKCEKCHQIVSTAVAKRIPCVPTRMRMQFDGTITNHHVRDSTWDINEYITDLRKSLKSWRKTYWRLWGNAHFLYCLTCKRFFPSNQIGWCRYHPDPAQFFTLDAQKAPLPVGRFPCCGERAYRFQLLNNHSGCQFREHSICTKDVRDSAIYSILNNYKHLIVEDPPQLMFPERLTRLVAKDPDSCGDKLVCKESFWWDGLEAVPPRPHLGLLTYFANREQTFHSKLKQPEDSSEGAYSDSSDSSSDSNSSTNSAEYNPKPRKKMIKAKRRKPKREGHLWIDNISARSNQDVQRAHEEKLIRQMTAVLNRRVLIQTDNHNRNKGLLLNNIPIGGIWVRLETEWKDHNMPHLQNKRNTQRKTKL